MKRVCKERGDGCCGYRPCTCDGYKKPTCKCHMYRCNCDGFAPCNCDNFVPINKNNLFYAQDNPNYLRPVDNVSLEEYNAMIVSMRTIAKRYGTPTPVDLNSLKLVTNTTIVRADHVNTAIDNANKIIARVKQFVDGHVQGSNVHNKTLPNKVNTGDFVKDEFVEINNVLAEYAYRCTCDRDFCSCDNLRPGGGRVPCRKDSPEYKFKGSNDLLLVMVREPYTWTHNKHISYYKRSILRRDDDAPRWDFEWDKVERGNIWGWVDIGRAAYRYDGGIVITKIVVENTRLKRSYIYNYGTVDHRSDTPPDNGKGKRWSADAGTREYNFPKTAGFSYMNSGLYLPTKGSVYQEKFGHNKYVGDHNATITWYPKKLIPYRDMNHIPKIFIPEPYGTSTRVLINRDFVHYDPAASWRVSVYGGYKNDDGTYSFDGKTWVWINGNLTTHHTYSYLRILNYTRESL